MHLVVITSHGNFPHFPGGQRSTRMVASASSVTSPKAGPTNGTCAGARHFTSPPTPPPPPPPLDPSPAAGTAPPGDGDIEPVSFKIGSCDSGLLGAIG